MKIIKRICWQVDGRIYASKRTAASSLAWRMIYKKYGNALSTVGDIGGMKCTCSPNNAQTIYVASSTTYSTLPFSVGTAPTTGRIPLTPLRQITDISKGCPIHDRKTGYFHRLSRRLTKQILLTMGKTKNDEWFIKTVTKEAKDGKKNGKGW
jgi:hypothetical protein